MNPLWSDEPHEPRKPAPDPPPARRHARLYEAEYAKQLRRIERIRKAVGGDDTPAPPPQRHRSWDEPPTPAPRTHPPAAAEPDPAAAEERTRDIAARDEPAGTPATGRGRGRPARSHDAPAAPLPGRATEVAPGDTPAARRRAEPPPARRAATALGGWAGQAPEVASVPAESAPRDRAVRAAAPQDATALRGSSALPDARVVAVERSASPPRLLGGWRPPPADDPGVVREEVRRVSRVVVGAALAAVVAAAAFAVLAGRDAGPRPELIPLPAPATDIAAAGGWLWAAAPEAGEVWMLDRESGAPVRPALRTGGTPARLAVGEAGAWAADTARGALVQLRRGRAMARVRVGPDVADVGLSRGRVWAVSAADGMVRVLDRGGRAARAIAVGGHPVALAADSRSVVVAAAGGTVTWLDARTRRSVAAVRVGGMPIAVAMDGGAAWVADAHAGTIRRIAPRRGSGAAATTAPGARRTAPATRGAGAGPAPRVVAGPPISVGREPVAIAARDGNVYVVCRGDRELVVVDARRGVVTRTVALGVEPAAIAVDAEYVWIAASGRSAVLRVDRRRLS